MRRDMRNPLSHVFLLSILALSIPHLSEAQSVSVLIGPYKMLWEDDAPVAERAAAVAEAICAGAVSAGFNASLNGRCASDACLQKALRDGYDQAIYADVTASDAGYEVIIKLAPGNEKHLSLSGAFADAAEQIATESLSMLKAKKEEGPAKTIEPPPGDEASPIDTAPKNPAVAAGPDKKPTEKHRIHPAIFFTGIGLSAGLTGAFIALDTVTHNRYQKLEQGDKDTSYWNTSTHLQIASRVCFGVGLAAIVATVAVAPFTDFKYRRTRRKVSFSAGPAENGGAVILQGRF